MSMKFKLGIAVFFAIIAALTAMIAGLVSDARISIVLLRTVCSFFVTGVLVYIGAFLFEKIGYGSLIKETEQAMTDLKQKEKQEQSEAEAEAAGDAQDKDAVTEPQPGKSNQEGFAPLDTDSLRKVTGSSES